MPQTSQLKGFIATLAHEPLLPAVRACCSLVPEDLQCYGSVLQTYVVDPQKTDGLLGLRLTG